MLEEMSLLLNIAIQIEVTYDTRQKVWVEKEIKMPICLCCLGKMILVETALAFFIGMGCPEHYRPFRIHSSYELACRRGKDFL